MVPVSRPLQKISWAEKIKDNYKFFKENVDWGVQTSVWSNMSVDQTRTSIMLGLYQIYNSRFPAHWFKHVLDPFSSKKEQHKQWAGKIRPANIIRPNIDLLRGEYEKRPSECHIEVRGEQGYNNFLEARKGKMYQTVSQIFINEVNNQMSQQQSQDPNQPQQQQSSETPTGVDSKPVQPPEQVASDFAGDYKDILAVQAQADFEDVMEEQSIHEKRADCMKDWLIAGEAYSWKGVYRDKVHFERISPLELDYDKSPHIKYIKDGSWACRRIYMTVPDVVDRYYDSLKEEEISDLETTGAITSPAVFYNYLQNDKLYAYNKIPVYHFTWKSMQKIGHLSGTDPVTGTPYEDIVNDTYKANSEMGETIEWEWVSQVLEGTRIGDKIYVEMGIPTYQPNQLADYSKHELPYNGKRFSDTHADNISVAKLGLPFQIMYVILFFTLETTIAKSGGKIVFLDQNAIPRQNGWDDEKFFYFAKAQGYAVMNRSQTGVDKSWQSYQVLDLGLFEHIKELINTMNFCREEYDQQLGINRQAKGQTYASDSATGNQAALFQSSVITEMIFADFDGFVKTDNQGLIDCTQIANRNGKRRLYKRDDVGTALLEIDPDYYCYAELGIHMVNNVKESAALERVRQYTQAFAQKADISPATVVEIETANNVAKLKSILKDMEAKQQALAAQQQQSEHENEVEQIQIKQQFAEYNSLLETEFMHEEYTEKQQLVLLQGDINIAVQEIAQGMSPDTTNGADITEIMARQNEREQMYHQKDMHNTSEKNKSDQERAKIMMAEKKLGVERRKQESTERIAAANNKTAIAVAKMRPKPKPAKKS
jgi:hypothetical protein